MDRQEIPLADLKLSQGKSNQLALADAYVNEEESDSDDRIQAQSSGNTHDHSLRNQTTINNLISQVSVSMISENDANFDSEKAEKLSEMITKRHQQNSMQDNLIEKARDYTDKLTYNIPLNELYKVSASCHDTERQDFCAVLIQIVDDKIFEINGKKRYLLQIWSKKGDMVFERSLLKPVCNWAIDKDKFLFQEEPDSREIYLVCLFIERAPFIYKFQLPNNATKNRVNTHFDESTKKFVIPEEKAYRSESEEMEDEEECEDLGSNNGFHRSVSMIRQDIVFVQPDSKMDQSVKMSMSQTKVAPDLPVQPLSESISKKFSTEIIERAPDKMLAYIKGFIVLAYRNEFIYFNVGDIHGIDSAKIEDDQFEKSISIPQSELAFMNLHKSYKIISLQQIGRGESCAVIESVITRSIKYLKIALKTENFERQLILTTLGINVEEKKVEAKQPLLKYRGIAKYDKTQNTHYYISLVLRTDGQVEIYSDFILVDSFRDHDKQCVDIETDEKRFYFKIVSESHTLGSQHKYQDICERIEIYRCKHKWRNLINMHTSKKKTQKDKWDMVIHKRIANFVRLYSQIISFSTYMLVTHRDMISIFDMRNEQLSNSQWIDTMQMPGPIHKMFIHKKPKSLRLQESDKSSHIDTQASPVALNRTPSLHAQSENELRASQKNGLSQFNKFEILCIVGPRMIVYTEMIRTNQKINLMRKLVHLPCKGRILNFINDKHYNFGSTILTDTKVKKDENTFKNVLGCKLQLFPYARLASDTGEVTLSALKMRTFYPLLKSSESESELTYSTVCCLAQANREQFEVEIDQFQEESASSDVDLVKELYGKQSSINVLVCVNQQDQSTKMYPIIKSKKNDSKIVDDIYLIKNPSNTRKFQTDSNSSTDRVLQNFFVTLPEFGSYNDSYTQIGEKYINIFDKNQNLMKTFTGLNMRSVINVHQSYLYTVSDAVEAPFTMTDHQNGQGPSCQDNQKTEPEGIFVFNLAALFKGRIEKYKLASCIGGLSCLIDHNVYSDRLSFIQSFNTIAVVPLPHLNLLNCIGMSNKHDYLIWREKNGFFTALDNAGDLNTWSLLSGKLLYTIRQTGDASFKSLSRYEVQRANDKDITYTRNFYNFEDQSVNLLRSKQPVGEIFEELTQSETKINVNTLRKALNKQETKNDAGLANFQNQTAPLPDQIFQGSNSRAKVSLINSEIQSEYYHYKVMRLQTFEDTKTVPQCSVRFHFLFPIIKKRSQTKTKGKKQNCSWDIVSEPVQHLYLSQDTHKLMEVVNNIFATVYQRTNIDKDGHSVKQIDTEQKDEGQHVKWKVDYHIRRYPTKLCQKTSVPYIFSPNFTYQIDFLFRSKQIVIRETKSQEIYMVLPADLINAQMNQISGAYGVQINFSRLKWHSERQLRFVTHQNKDCIMEMCSSDPTDSDPDKRYMKVVSVSKIDNLHTNKHRLNAVHLLHEPFTLEPRDVLERLIRVNQLYKTSLQHAINLGDKKFNLLAQINKIDYLQPWGNLDSSFAVEKSFTLLDWIIMEESISQANFDLRLVDAEQKIQLCFNIYPNGRGILHHLAATGSIEDDGKTGKTGRDASLAYFPTKDLFDVASQPHQLYLTGVDDEVMFEIPILQDIYGQNPLDICLCINQGVTRLQHQDFFIPKKPQKIAFETAQENNVNLIMANLILESITEYAFLHSSLQIIDSVIRATQLGLPATKLYLESRIKKTEHPLLTSSQRAIKNFYSRNSPSMGGEYGILFTSALSRASYITESLFDVTTPQRPMNLQEIDLPQFHKRTPEGDDFIRALSKCPDLDFFALKSVQIMIDAHGKRWNFINRMALGIPMFIQLLCFWYWSNIVLPHINISEETFKVQDTICVVILSVISLYLLILEIGAIVKTRFVYLTYPTQFMNIIAPSLIMANVFRDNYDEQSFWRVQSWATLFVWMRFLFWLRNINAFSWLVRLVTECIKDMITFLVVLIMGVFAFADAFQSIDKQLVIRGDIEAKEFDINENLYERYFKTFTEAWQHSFLVALGEFDYINLDFFNEGDFLIFFICCIFNIILLLNLLIAIISETYSRVSEVSIQTQYKEQAYQIIHMQDYAFGFLRRKKADPCELLIVAQEISSEHVKDYEDDDYIAEQLSDMQDQMSGMQDELQSFMDDRLFKLSTALMYRISQNTTTTKPVANPITSTEKVENVQQIPKVPSAPMVTELLPPMPAMMAPIRDAQDISSDILLPPISPVKEKKQKKMEKKEVKQESINVSSSSLNIAKNLSTIQPEPERNSFMNNAPPPKQAIEDIFATKFVSNKVVKQSGKMRKVEVIPVEHDLGLQMMPQKRDLGTEMFSKKSKSRSKKTR